MRVTFIEGEGEDVNDDPAAVDGDSLLLVDKFLLFLLELLLLPAFKFIRLSFCTLCLTI